MAECCKRQLNQGRPSFVLLYFRLLTFSDLYWICLSLFSCTVLFVSIIQVIGCEDRLRNDLYCVEWGVKLYSNQPTNQWKGRILKAIRQVIYEFDIVAYTHSDSAGAPGAKSDVHDCLVTVVVQTRWSCSFDAQITTTSCRTDGCNVTTRVYRSSVGNSSKLIIQPITQSINLSISRSIDGSIHYHQS